MAHAVFIQNPTSVFSDVPGEIYNFPHQYLSRVERTVGDWVIVYEGRSGAFGYTAVQKVIDVKPDPFRERHYNAIIEPGSLLEFERVVPRQGQDGIAYESSLRGADGRPTSGGQNVSSVRLLPSADFAAIIDAGLEASREPDAMPRVDAPGLSDEAAPFAGLAPDRRRVIASRPFRDQAFERMVKSAYGGRCAISGLMLRNGGGRPEVQAAHIRPVSHHGPDVVSNGLALSGTLHWMFDRGLISISEDLSILVSHNKVDADTARRLITPGAKLILPRERRHHPHKEYLQYHREEIYGKA
ncbi:HNH endonuclease [Pseudooceanicola sp. LIPI14-2-Ac024]|uniref:HNH endonuclease n=1 Tax=Pseudooceanicola sp. LIPI14-2-Ac024 TaxID=3344875 RepID=UPI0035D0546F